MLEQIEPAGDLAGVERAASSAARFSRHRATVEAIGGSKIVVLAESIEQVALPALVEQAALVVLAVDLDQGAHLLGQSRGGHGRVVDAGRRAAIGRDLAHGDERLGQPIEQRLDPRHVGAVADERRVGPRPERQPERIDEQAFARAGLAGDDVEPGVERQAESIDEREIDDGQLEQAPERGRIALVVRARSVVGVWCVVRVRS